MNPAGNEPITLFVQQYTGGITAITVTPGAEIVAVAMAAHARRAKAAEPVKMMDYARAVTLMWREQRLQWDKSIADYNIPNRGTIHEVCRRWTSGHNVDRATMTVECPIGLAKAKQPVLLECGHVYDRPQIVAYAGRGGRNCPLCNRTFNPNV